MGNYSAFKTSGDVNVPITAALAARASFQTSTHSGYLSDGEADDDTKAGRLQLLYDPTTKLSFLLSGDVVDQGGRGGGSALIGHGYSASDRIGLADPIVGALESAKGIEVVSAGQLYQNNQFSGAKGEMNWTTKWGTLTVVPAFRHASLDFSALFGGGEKDAETDNQGSFEARFASLDRGFLRWIVGAFYLKDSVNANFRIDNLNNTGNQQLYNTGTKSQALFADLTAHFTDKFQLFGGIRDTQETKWLNGSLHNPFLANPRYIVVDRSTTYSKPTWRAGVRYKIRPQSMLYATVSTGFRSGGYYFTVDNPVFNPETITAYTVGAKNRFLNNRMQLRVPGHDGQDSGLMADSVPE